METTNIRVHGDREYWDKVAIFARQHRTSISALVKDAMDRLYGSSLSAIDLHSFPSNIADQQISNTSESDHA